LHQPSLVGSPDAIAGLIYDLGAVAGGLGSRVASRLSRYRMKQGLRDLRCKSDSFGQYSSPYKHRQADFPKAKGAMETSQKAFIEARDI